MNERMEVERLVLAAGFTVWGACAVSLAVALAVLLELLSGAACSS